MQAGGRALGSWPESSKDELSDSLKWVPVDVAQVRPYARAMLMHTHA